MMHLHLQGWQEWVAFVLFLGGTVLFFVWVGWLWLKK
jgi:hypothetical protein